MAIPKGEKLTFILLAGWKPVWWSPPNTLYFNDDGLAHSLQEAYDHQTGNCSSCLKEEL